jgi:hypothetical protein
MVFKTVRNTVTNLLDEVVNSCASMGILETMASTIPSSRREKSPIGSTDIEADKAKFFDERNESMKGFLIQSSPIRFL